MKKSVFPFFPFLTVIVIGLVWAQELEAGINYSCKFNGTQYISRTPTGAGNRKTWTYSTWVKRGALSYSQEMFSAATGGAYYSSIYFDPQDHIQIHNHNGAPQVQLKTSAAYTDTGSWYHICVAVDTTQATPSDRVRLYVNGSQVTAFAIEPYPDQNLEWLLNNAIPHTIGVGAYGSNYFNGLLAEPLFVGGAQLTPSSFGELTAGVWLPKQYTGNYGTNGFRLDFANSADLGNDVSGNNTDFTTSGLSSSDQSMYGGVILGSKTFVKEVLARLQETVLEKGEIANRRQLHRSWECEDVIEAVRSHFQALPGGHAARPKECRDTTIYLLKRYAPVTNQQIGELCGNMSYSAVAKAHRRFSKGLSKSSFLRKSIREITTAMSNVKV